MSPMSFGHFVFNLEFKQKRPSLPTPSQQFFALFLKSFLLVNATLKERFFFFEVRQFVLIGTALVTASPAPLNVLALSAKKSFLS